MNKAFFLGATVAVGAVMLVPGVALALGRAGRPVAKAAARTGAVAYKEFREAGAEAFEHMEDFAAEFRAEFDRELRRADDASAHAGTEPEPGADAPADPRSEHVG
jgi:hypothetical protein